MEGASFYTARDAFHTEREAAGGKEYRYCNNTEYEYVYDAIFNYTDIGCKFVQEEEIAIKGESMIFFSTAVQDTSVAFVEKPSGGGGECARELFTKLQLDCPAGADVTEAIGRCYCRHASTTFVAAAENMTLNFEHKYDSW